MFLRLRGWTQTGTCPRWRNWDVHRDENRAHRAVRWTYHVMPTSTTCAVGVLFAGWPTLDKGERAARRTYMYQAGSLTMVQCLAGTGTVVQAMLGYIYKAKTRLRRLIGRGDGESYNWPDDKANSRVLRPRPICLHEDRQQILHTVEKAGWLMATRPGRSIGNQ